MFKRPKLALRVESTGGGHKITFTAFASNRCGVLARGCVLTAELEDEGVVYRSPPFELGRKEIDYPLHFGLERPRHGDVVGGNPRDITLYGRVLTVQLECGRQSAKAVFKEA
jgi:hypothetical protein